MVGGLKEALVWLGKYIGQVLQCPENLCDLRKLLLDEKLVKVAGALDRVTDLEAYAPWRDDYEALCDLLEDAQFLLLTARSDSAAGPSVARQAAGSEGNAACASGATAGSGKSAGAGRRRQQLLRYICLHAPETKPAREHLVVPQQVALAPRVAQLLELLKPYTQLDAYLKLHEAFETYERRAKDHASSAFPRQYNKLDSLRNVARTAHPQQARAPARCAEYVSQHEETFIPELEALMVGDIPQTRSIAITGLGGLGKTTIATELYRRLKTSFREEDCVWLTVARPNASPGDYVGQSLSGVHVYHKLEQARSRPIENCNSMARLRAHVQGQMSAEHKARTLATPLVLCQRVHHDGCCFCDLGPACRLSRSSFP